GKMDTIETNIETLSQRADTTAFVGEEIKSVQTDFSKFKERVFDKTDIIEEKIKTVSDILKKQDIVDEEFHKKSDKLFDEIQNVKNIANKTSNNSSKEMMALLKLSEYQSTMRMNTESKYGVTGILEKMGKQTADISNLFDNISKELDEKIPFPNEVRQWAVSKILDCADKWEIRFSDVYSILTNTIGRDILKEIIRIQQIRDIYGIRAVDEIRKDLNIS
ncbi:MAG: chemotaxis protein, partial [Nitrosopumilus sp.]